MSGNRLSSLDGLAEGCTRLHELYAADNGLTSLAGLAARAPALETLVRERLCFLHVFLEGYKGAGCLVRA